MCARSRARHEPHALECYVGGLIQSLAGESMEPTEEADVLETGQPWVHAYGLRRDPQRAAHGDRLQREARAEDAGVATGRGEERGQHR